MGFVDTEKMCNIYVDGACNIETKVGAWSYVVFSENGIIKKCGSKKDTTINAMELKAVCEALNDCKNLGYKNIKVYSDSSYVVNTILNRDMVQWKNNRWKNRKGRDIRNKYLWKKLYILLNGKDMDISLYKVKAHSGNRGNMMADFLAKEAVKHSNVCTGMDS